MILTDAHIEAIRAAALHVEFGSIRITAGTDRHIDVVIENRIRLPKESGAALKLRDNSGGRHAG